MKAGRRRSGGRWAAWLAAAGGLLACLPGCGEQAGAFLYFFKLYPKQKIPAEFTLTSGRLLVLIDDDADLITEPGVKQALTEGVAANLRENRVKATVIPFEQLKTLQRHQPDFETTAADRIGKLLDADQVLWIKVDRFSTGSVSASDVGKAATFTVNLRVLTTKAASRDEVQLWPEAREPRKVSADLSLAMVQMKNDPRVITEMLSEALAKSIAELFYEHPMEEPT